MNILVTGARAPIAADLARALSMAGHKVWVADNLRYPVSVASPFVQGLVRLPAPRVDFRGFVAALKTSCSNLAIDAIIPTSEEVFWLAAAAPALPTSVNVRVSDFRVLRELHHKELFAKLACRMGYGVAENHLIARTAELDRFTSPADYVFKPVYSRFACRTLISPARRDLQRLQPSESDPWLAQTRVRGRELCVYNVADRGRLLLHVAYEPMFRAGVGAGLYFSPVHHEQIRLLSERIIKETNFTGQIGFDVMETEKGLVALECNPRGTSGVHLAAQQPEALAAALLGCAPTLNSGFLAEPRMLFFPLGLYHPGLVFSSRDRERVRQAKDAMRVAGISLFAQAKALAEMSWYAARAGKSMPEVSTVGIEWNGESIGG